MINSKIRKRWISGLFIAITSLIILAIVIKISPLPCDSTWKGFEASLEEGEVILDGAIDGKTAYTIVATKGQTDYGNFFVVFEQQPDQNWKLSYCNDFKDLKPWKLELGDVDGDKIIEILIAVKKTTHFDPEEKNRLFVFNYDKEKLVKKWTGSQPDLIWRDFIIGDLLPIAGEEVIFTEQAEDGKERLSIYYWFEFGFVKLAESDSYEDILNLSILQENRIRMSYNKALKKEVTLTVKNGRIVEENNK